MTNRPLLRHALRLSGAVLAGLAVVLIPDVASAATTVPNHTVLPVLDCVTDNGDGTYTGVLGYDNTSKSSVTIPDGTQNNIAPKQYDGAQPTTFAPGVQHGVFSLTVAATSGSVSWNLNGSKLDSASAATSATCPPATQMPAEGNGTGEVVALAAAGAIGALTVARFRRRARRAAAPEAPRA